MIIVKLQSIKDKQKKIHSCQGEGTDCPQSRQLGRILSATLDTKKHKTTNQKKSQSRIIYPDKLSFRGDIKLKIFSHIK